MNKVEQVNLSGRAYQLEERAYEQLVHYLASARRKLADDPDQEEVMRDFEQAVAEKCDALLTEHKNVITADEMKQIIASMGPVEASEGAEERKAAQDPVQKRLYILQEGSMIGGVCNGLASYLNIDVTVIRLIFVILAFATSGGWVLVYLLLLIVLPTAKTPEQKAELRGERFTAQDLIERAKQKYSDAHVSERVSQAAKNSEPALAQAGRVLSKIVRVLALSATVFIGFLAAISFALVIVSVWMLISGRVDMVDQLSTVSTWALAGWLISAYTLVLIPGLAVAAGLFRVGQGKTDKKMSTSWSIAAGVAWMVAFTALIGVSVVIGPRLSEYRDTHGYIRVEDRKALCVNAELCDGYVPDTRIQEY